MAKSKSGSKKPSLSNGRKGKGGGAAVAAAKRRGPKTHLEASKGKVDEEMIRGAKEMLDEESDGAEGEDEEYLGAGGSTDFLLRLDEKGVSRTHAEVQRLRRQDLARAQEEDRQNGVKKRKQKGKGRVEEEEEEEEDGNSTDMEGASLPSEGETDEGDSMLSGDDEQGDSGKEASPDREASHLEKIERSQKRRKMEQDEELQQRKKKKLPTRGADGWSSGEDIDEEEGDEGDGSLQQYDQQPSSRVVHQPLAEVVEEEERERQRMPKPKSTITTGTRFGLQSPYDILTMKKKSQRIMIAREQIARLSTDIINDPEVSLGFIKRLSVFAAPSVQSAEDKGKKARVDDAIRASAILSLCAIFVDILPGYRIRSLSEGEKNEKVNQELARRREWEQGLVVVYRDFLELCERVTRDKSELSKISLKAMCTLVTRATQFNYRTNLLRSLVSYLSRKSWDAGSEEANGALIEVLKADNQGEVSLEVVRLLNRMIKEKRFQVHERVLEMLGHLRLRNELRAERRGNMTTVSRHTDAFDKSLKPKDVRKGKGQHLSKKGVKKMREVREIEEEMKEAEAEVNEEERERHQSETLKLLFVLYFSILKAPIISNKLYVATLHGLALFAHRINVDFFRDLLDVLRLRIRLSLGALDESDDEDDDGEEDEDGGQQDRATNLMTALHCIATSFELLSGQGEALNIDLSDIVTHLFAILLPLAMNPDLEATHETRSSDSVLLLRAIHLCLVAPPIHSLPTERLAAFVIRMLNCALHTPPKTTLGLLNTIRILMSKKDELKGLLDNADRAKNGRFDPSSDLLDGLRPMQSGYILWQLEILRRSCHEEVKEQSGRILSM